MSFLGRTVLNAYFEIVFFFAKIFELVAAGRIDCADGGDPSGSLCTVFT